MQSDHKRYKDKVKGINNDNLRKYVTDGGFHGKKGKKVVKVPIPVIQHPRFIEEPQDPSGVGQGPGKPGDKLGPYKPGQQPGDGDEAGDQPGEHYVEVDITIEELIKQLGEQLELPNIRKTEEGDIYEIRYKYNTVVPEGPRSRVLFKRTWKEAMKRELIELGTLIDTKKPFYPKIVNRDFRYRGAREIREPITRAVIFYMMDVSGSMTQEKKDIVRTESFWIDEWIRYQYKNAVHSRYIIHDTHANEVTKEEFYTISTGGGTMISSSFVKANEIIEAEYRPFNSWNIYLFHFTDGENWGEDTSKVIDSIVDDHYDRSNQVAIVQIEGTYSSGSFGRDVKDYFGEDEKIVVSYIASREGIWNSIKDVLGKGN